MHRAEANFVGLLCFLVVLLPIAIWIEAHILRLAIRFTNAFLAESSTPNIEFYDTLGKPVYMPSRAGQPLPVPDIGRNMVILFAAWFLSFPARGMVLLIIALSQKKGISAIDAQGTWLHLLDANSQAMMANLVALAVQTMMISLLLPTSFGRACLVMLVRFLMVMAFVCGVFCLIYVVKVPMPHPR
jgi:hypothetical protein